MNTTISHRSGGWAVAAALLGLAVLVAAMMAGLGTRWGLWHFRTGFDILRWATYASFATVLIAIIALLRRRNWPLALFGLLAALVIITNSWLMMKKARSVPPIHDITTDTENPPQFVAILEKRRDAANPPDYEGGEVASQQKQAYPDIVSLHLDIPADSAFRIAREAAEDMGWEIVAAEPREGRIEATARTFWFGFYDDVVVRITPDNAGAIIDVRSKSRVGRSDVGTNAARIRKYFEEIRDELGDARD